MASSLQSSPAPKVTRSLDGTAQYGPVRMSDRLGRPIAGMPWPNQMNPMTVPMKMPSTAKNSRRRSSYRCSISDIVPSADLSDPPCSGAAQAGAAWRAGATARAGS